MRRRSVLVTAFWFASLGWAQAQTSGMSDPTAMQGPAKSAADLLVTFEGECMSAARAMPADKYNFAPGSLAIVGAKFDGVRTFADQVRHLTQANYYFASTVAQAKPDVDMKTIGALKSKDELVAALANSFAALHKANATLTAQNAFEVVDFEGGKSTRSTVASFAVAHGFDHYGQMVEYLRMNGIVPPASAK